MRLCLMAHLINHSKKPNLCPKVARVYGELRLGFLEAEPITANQNAVPRSSQRYDQRGTKLHGHLQDGRITILGPSSRPLYHHQGLPPQRNKRYRKGHAAHPWTLQKKDPEILKPVNNFFL